jgi:hypothetical protein
MPSEIRIKPPVLLLWCGVVSMGWRAVESNTMTLEGSHN